MISTVNGATNRRGVRNKVALITSAKKMDVYAKLTARSGTKTWRSATSGLAKILEFATKTGSANVPKAPRRRAPRKSAFARPKNYTGPKKRESVPNAIGKEKIEVHETLSPSGSVLARERPRKVRLVGSIRIRGNASKVKNVRKKRK